MLSMTSFGHSLFNSDHFSLDCIIKTLNSRFIEINVSLPSFMQEYEPYVVSKIKESIKRGHIDVNIKFQLKSENTLEQHIRYVSKINRICRKNKIRPFFSLNEFLFTVNNLNTREENTDIKDIKQVLFRCVDESLLQINQERTREGLATYNDLVKNLNRFSDALTEISKYSETIEETVSRNLTEKIKNYIDVERIDPNLLLTEVALTVNRMTINEEIQRLTSHISHFRKLSETADEPVGKRLDFLCQEMLREVNTIGSKTQITEISLLIVTMKDCLENIREQVRNIE